MKFSVCIPNYNYARYLGRTLQSTLAQDGVDLEVLVSDNASTDESRDVVKATGDGRVRLRVNACNVGFAGNLDRAAGMASGDVMLMLSSDDLMRPGALETYRRILGAVGESASTSVITSAAEIIDPEDRVTGRIGIDAELWKPEDEVQGLPAPEGAKVYRVEARELLRRCLRTCRNPFNFLATAYPRALYRQLEGYGGSRLINPDKWFHWRLLGVASHAYFVDAPLFAYRWHGSNQVAQQAQAGALKYLVDEYVNTFDVPQSLLEAAGVTRDELERAFVEYDVARHGLATLASGARTKARRILFFGASTYPSHALRNGKFWVLAALLSAGPVGQKVASVAYRRYRDGIEQGDARG